MTQDDMLFPLHLVAIDWWHISDQHNEVVTISDSVTSFWHVSTNCQWWTFLRWWYFGADGIVNMRCSSCSQTAVDTKVTLCCRKSSLEFKCPVVGDRSGKFPSKSFIVPAKGVLMHLASTSKEGAKGTLLSTVVKLASPPTPRSWIRVILFTT